MEDIIASSSCRELANAQGQSPATTTEENTEIITGGSTVVETAVSIETTQVDAETQSETASTGEPVKQ